MQTIKDVLKLLEEKRINSDEAYSLIQHIEKEHLSDKTPSAGAGLKDGIAAVLSSIPNMIKSAGNTESIDREIPANDRILDIEGSMGDITLKPAKRDNILIKGEGSLNYDNNKIFSLTGDMEIVLPLDMKRVTASVKTGDLSGTIQAKQAEIKIGAGAFEGTMNCSNGQVDISLGSAEIALEKCPESLLIKCSMGSVELKIPEHFDGVMEINNSFGSIEVNENLNFEKEGNTYIFGSGKSRIVINNSMGSIEIA